MSGQHIDILKTNAIDTAFLQKSTNSENCGYACRFLLDMRNYCLKMLLKYSRLSPSKGYLQTNLSFYIPAFMKFDKGEAWHFSTAFKSEKWCGKLT